MNRNVGRVWVVGMVVLACFALAAHAQEHDMSMPKPGPEHKHLAKAAGTWDATISMQGATSKGTETNKLINGMWVVTDFQGEMMGAPFTGHGMSGYDPMKKKYISYWVDSMSQSIMVTEGELDKDGKTLTSWGEVPDPSGKMMKAKLVDTWTDADTHVFTFNLPGPDGKDMEMMSITYKRRK